MVLGYSGLISSSLVEGVATASTIDGVGLALNRHGPLNGERLGQFLSSGRIIPERIFSRMCMVRRSDLDMQVWLTRFSLMPAEWHSLPHSRRGILEKQYSFLTCLSITSWECFMHSLPLRDSDPDRMPMEEDMPPVGLPKNLTHLSDSLTSSSLRWLGRGLQVLEGRETR